MSIWIRRKQAEKYAKHFREEHAKRRKRPTLGALSLPEDVAENDMRFILTGGRRALVENYLNVVEVSETLIRLRTRAGLLEVQGRGLALEDVRLGALAVIGEIEWVRLPNRTEGAEQNA